MIFKYSIEIDTDEATPAELYEGVQDALQVIKLPDGSTLYLDVDLKCGEDTEESTCEKLAKIADDRY